MPLQNFERNNFFALWLRLLSQIVKFEKESWDRHTQIMREQKLWKDFKHDIKRRIVEDEEEKVNWQIFPKVQKEKTTYCLFWI